MSINYGYFRHRLDATNDPKIQKIIDLLGVEGLGFWWSLVELYGTAYNNSNREDLTVKIHKRVIANTWRKRVDSCDKVLTKLQLSGNLVVTSHDSTYELTIPNFLKYFGSYQKKKQERTLKKRKENKRKEIIKQECKFDLNLIYGAYPKKAGKAAGLKKLNSKIKTQDDFDKILHGAKIYSEYCAENKVESKYIKQFSTWVNQECWNDELETNSVIEDKIQDLDKKFEDYLKQKEIEFRGE